MATLRLNERRVDTFKPRKSAYDVRDRELTGFGVRVLPSGAKRYFIHSQHHGRRVWKIVGRAGAIGVDEARKRARVMLASIRNGTSEQAAAPQDTIFEIVGDEVFRRYARNWKPSRSTRTTTATIFCRGSKVALSPTSPLTTSNAGSRRSTILRCRRTGLPPSCRSSCARPRSTATGRKEPIHARASGDIGARGGSASCREQKSADWARCWLATKPVARRLPRSYDCFSSPDAARARSSL